LPDLLTRDSRVLLAIFEQTQSLRQEHVKKGFRPSAPKIRQLRLVVQTSDDYSQGDADIVLAPVLKAGRLLGGLQHFVHIKGVGRHRIFRCAINRAQGI
jgi:hypothetical protein